MTMPTYLKDFEKRSKDRIRKLERPDNYEEQIKLHKQIIIYCSAFHNGTADTFLFSDVIDADVIASYRDEMTNEKKFWEREMFNQKLYYNEFQPIKWQMNYLGSLIEMLDRQLENK